MIPTNFLSLLYATFWLTDASLLTILKHKESWILLYYSCIKGALGTLKENAKELEVIKCKRILFLFAAWNDGFKKTQILRPWDFSRALETELSGTKVFLLEGTSQEMLLHIHRNLFLCTCSSQVPCNPAVRSLLAGSKQPWRKWKWLKIEQIETSCGDIWAAQKLL